MPAWTPQWQDVRFDHAAAARLAAEASALAAQLTSDAGVRGDLAAAVLADWRGRRADRATPRLRGLPDELEERAADLRNLAATVEQASAEARAEQARREADRRRWHAERAAEQEAAREAQAREAALAGSPR